MAIFNRFHHFIHCCNYFITTSIITIILSKTPKLYFIKNSIIDISLKTSYNNIIALTHLLQTKKHFQNFYQKIKEPIDIGSFIVYN